MGFGLRNAVGYRGALFALLLWGVMYAPGSVRRRQVGPSVAAFPPTDQAEVCTAVAFMFHHIFPDAETPILLSGGVQVRYVPGRLSVTRAQFLGLIRELLRRGYWFPSPQQFLSCVRDTAADGCAEPYAILIVDDPWNVPFIPVEDVRAIGQEAGVPVHVWAAIATRRITPAETAFLSENLDVLHPVSHSASHNMHLSDWLDQGREAEVVAELEESQQFIARMDPGGSRIFVYPGGNQSAALVRWVARYYDAAFLASPLLLADDDETWCLNRAIPRHRYLLPRLNGAHWPSTMHLWDRPEGQDAPDRHQRAPQGPGFWAWGLFRWLRALWRAVH